MKIRRYNPSNMSIISSDISSIDFGNINIGQYCNSTIAIKLDPDEETLQELAFYLENRANLLHTRFGLYKSSTPVTGIAPNDSRINIFLEESPGVSDLIQYSDQKISLNPSDPEYIWLNIFVGRTETNLGNHTINYRFVFEYH